MDVLQKSQLKQSELKVKLTELLDTPAETRAESFNDDLREATAQVKSVELEVQAALLAHPVTAEIVEKRTAAKPTETAEDKELVELRQAVHFSKYVAAALERRRCPSRSGAGIKPAPRHCSELLSHGDVGPCED